MNQALHARIETHVRPSFSQTATEISNAQSRLRRTNISVLKRIVASGCRHEPGERVCMYSERLEKALDSAPLIRTINDRYLKTLRMAVAQMLVPETGSERVDFVI